MEQIGAGRVIGPDRRLLPAPREAAHAPPAARPAGARCSARRCLTTTSCASSRGLGLDVTPTPDGWDVDRADLPRRSAARGRPHRGGRPALRLRQARADVSGRSRSRRRRRIRASRATNWCGASLTAAGCPKRSPSASSRPGPPSRLLSTGDGAQPVADRQPAVGEIRHAAPVAAAGPGRRRRAQPPARPARRAALRDRHAVRAPTARRGRRARLDRCRRRRHWSGGGRDVDFFDVKGVAEQLCRALGVAVGSSRPRRRFLVAGQAASIARGRRGDRRSASSVRCRRPIADARGLPRQDAVFVAELNLDALGARAGAPMMPARPLPRYPFVVRDLSIVVADTLPAEIIRGTIQTAGTRRRRRRSSRSAFRSLSGQGRAGRSVSLSCGSRFRRRSHADRRGRAAELRRHPAPRSGATQHGAVSSDDRTATQLAESA